MPNFLVMILPFSQWYVTQLLCHYLLIRTNPKYCNGHANGLVNTDASKQAQDIVFSHTKNPSNYSDICFNNISLKRKNTQKHL